MFISRYEKRDSTCKLPVCRNPRAKDSAVIDLSISPPAKQTGLSPPLAWYANYFEFYVVYISNGSLLNVYHVILSLKAHHMICFPQREITGFESLV